MSTLQSNKFIIFYKDLWADMMRADVTENEDDKKTGKVMKNALLSILLVDKTKH